jgi:ankyrin repeat protein
MLIGKGANVTARNKYGRTPLHEACAFGSIESMIVLMAHGADPHDPDSDGLSSLHHAVASGKADVVQYLLDYARNK